MKSITKSLKDIGFLTIALTLALAANFAYGQWSNPPAAAPGGNVAAPINVSGDDQTKSGTLNVWTLTSNRIVANSVKSGIMRSALYCDENGQNCIAQADLGGAAAASGCTWPTGDHMEIISKRTPSKSNINSYTVLQCQNGSWDIILET